MLELSGRTCGHNKMRTLLYLVVVVVVAMVPLLDAAVTIRAGRKGSDSLDKMPIIDGHNDLPWNLKDLEQNQLGKFNFTGNLDQDPKWNCSSCFTDIPRLRKGKVGAQFWVAYVSCSSQYKDAVEQTLEQIDVIKRLIQKYPDDLQYADSADGIEAAIANKKIASLICVEGGHSIDSRLGVLRLMYEMGARYLTLTHSCNTPWADASPADANSGWEHNGLSEWGKKVVKELNRLGMMVDLSHVSSKTMKAVLDITEAPVIFSHSSAYAVCNHHRNVQDDVLKMVADNNGVVMVNFYPGFTSCSDFNGTLETVVAHINHIRTVAGEDCVGIGGDYDGVNVMPEGLEDVSKYPDLFDRLATPKDGEPEWTDEQLQKLAGRNLLRVLRAVEKVRDDKKGLSPIDDILPLADLKKNIACRTDTGLDTGAGTSSTATWLLVLLSATVISALN